MSPVNRVGAMAGIAQKRLAHQTHSGGKNNPGWVALQAGDHG